MSFHSSLPTIISVYALTDKGRTCWGRAVGRTSSATMRLLRRSMLSMSPVTPGSGDSVAYLEILVTGQEDTGDDVARGARGGGANSQSDQGDGPGGDQSDLFYQRSGVSPYQVVIEVKMRYNSCK